MIRFEEVCVPLLSSRISLATTANPFPASPALAASIEAFKAKRLVLLEIPSIVPVSVLTFWNSSLNSLRTFSTSAESTAILLVVSTTSTSSSELVFACSTDASIKATTCSIRSATSDTCISIAVVISMEDMVLSFKTSFSWASSLISVTTASAPMRFSSASSLTTVTPSTTSLLATLTFSTVFTTRSKFPSIEPVNAPSDSTK